MEKISDKLPGVESDSGFYSLFINWLFGVILVYSFLFGTGKLIIGAFNTFSIYLLIAIISIVIIKSNLSNIG